jgi:hypothetical protein
LQKWKAKYVNDFPRASVVKMTSAPMEWDHIFLFYQHEDSVVTDNADLFRRGLGQDFKDTLGFHSESSINN